MKSLHFCTLAGALTGAALGVIAATATNDINTPLEDRVRLDTSPPVRTGPLGGYADVVEKVAPSVVSIFTSQDAQPANLQGTHPQWRRFFEERMPGMPKREGLGSGVILTSDGYIVTNNHVINNADEIKVALEENGDVYKAELVGQDPQTDLAVLKIDADNLPAVTVGDSSQLKVGDTVLAIGNPFGLDKTVTSGIVSALGRDNVGIVGYENFIQTDASINPGNSGGALVDNQGRVVGINTAILSRTGGNVGIGFAIPSGMVMNIADQIINSGEIQRGYLGVLLGEITPDLAKALGVERKGVLVNDVMVNTPAEEAGLENGDVITAVEGKTVNGVAELRLRVSNLRPGTELPIVVNRRGEELTLTATIGRLDQSELASGKPFSRGTPKSADALIDGVTVENLSPAYRNQLGLESDIEGIVATKVAPNSAAAEAGLSAGDVIVSVARQPVSHVNEALEARAQAQGDVLLLRVHRDGVSRFLAVPIN